jgi:hemerythrin superfamily protein
VAADDQGDPTHIQGLAVNLELPRRHLVLAGAAALLPLRESVAQTAAAGGDWFAMIQAHHALVARSFDQLLATGDRTTFLARDRMVRLIGYQLTAHSVAEENVIYPAIARAGMVTESDKLYLDQAHAKVMQSQLELQSRIQEEGTWVQAARTLQAAVLQHAKGDEEGRLYPQLRAKASASENAMLTALYRREFDSVKPLRATS